MLKRDLAIIFMACVAMLVSLQNEGTLEFRKAWYLKYGNQDDMFVEHHLLPQPVVADLNGDGHLEMVVATPDLQLQVVQPRPPGRAGDGFAPAKVIARASLLQGRVVASSGFRPVALSVGYLDPAPRDMVHAPRKQVVVVVTASWQVLVYDHNLRLMWEKQAAAVLTRHAHIDEVAVSISAHKVQANDRGLIVVGASMLRGDIATGEGLDAGGVGDEDIASAEEVAEARVKAHARSAGAKDSLDDLDAAGALGGAAARKGASSGSVHGLDTSRHFDYFAWEGGSGNERWHHTSTDWHKDLGDLAAELRPQNDYRLDAAKLEGRHYGEASCREYRESVLHALPHAWSSPLDTRLEQARFVRHKDGRGAQKEGLATRGSKGRPGSKGHQPTESHNPPQKGGLLGGLSGLLHRGDAAAGGDQQGRRAGRTEPRANITANALVAHLEEGIEVIHLFSGRTICELHLPRGELHADINGDGVLDHVQVFTGSDALGEDGTDAADIAAQVGGRRHRAASHCTAHVTSGVPATHHLFEANICGGGSSGLMAGLGSLAGGRAFSEEGGGALGAGAGAGLEIATPVFLPLPGARTGYRAHRRAHGLLVFMTSRGDVTALNARGQEVWQGAHPVSWRPRAVEQDAEQAAAEAPHAPTLAALPLHKHGAPSAVLAGGASGAVVLSEHGHALATLWMPSPPSQRLVADDFSGDGLTDIVAVTPDGIYAWAQVQKLGGTTLPALLITLLVAMGLLLWQHYGGGPIGMVGATGAGGPKGRKLRSTEYVD